jgi:hypothetical protein
LGLRTAAFAATVAAGSGTNIISVDAPSISGTGTDQTAGNLAVGFATGTTWRTGDSFTITVKDSKGDSAIHFDGNPTATAYPGSGDAPMCSGGSTGCTVRGTGTNTITVTLTGATSQTSGAPATEIIFLTAVAYTTKGAAPGPVVITTDLATTPSPPGAAASNAVVTGYLAVTTSLSHEQITENSSAASVAMKVKVTSLAGLPVANAPVTFSNSKQLLLTNPAGQLMVQEPINALDGLDNPVTVTVSVTYDDAVVLHTQPLFSTDNTEVCNFAGTPQSSHRLAAINFLEQALNNPYLDSFYQGLLAILPYIAKYHTTVFGYTITVPNNPNIYAAEVVVTGPGNTTVTDKVFYASKQILSPPSYYFNPDCTGPIA